MRSGLRFAVQLDRVEVALDHLADALDYQWNHDHCHDFRRDAQSARMELLLQRRGAGIAAKIMAGIMMPLMIGSIRKMIQADLDAIKLHCEAKT